MVDNNNNFENEEQSESLSTASFSSSTSTTGYSSDITSTLNVSSSDQSSSFTDYRCSSVIDKDTLSDRIAFLKEKQDILSRFSSHLNSEDVYVAYHAKLGGRKRTEPEIWKRARKLAKSNGKEKPPPAIIIPEKKLKATPRDLSIDINRVKTVSASDTTILSASDSSQSIVRKSAPLDTIDHWMIKTIERSHRPLTNKKWEYIPCHDYQPALVPPFACDDQMTMDQAIEITDEARIIASATPPFVVVYSNRAFLMMLRSPESIIGSPVESIIQVESDYNEATGPVHGRLRDQNDCLVHVDPIFDESRDAKVVTHILVRVEAATSASSTSSSLRKRKDNSVRVARAAKRHNSTLNTIG